jgi:ubiquinone biosynthesis UbiH/UbiF/VisC/COQ6 family hydroxylase
MIFDVIIVGGGLVGTSLALKLAQAGLSAGIVESRQTRTTAPVDSCDSRIYALGPGSVAFLEECGAWQGVAGERICAVEDMRVFGDAPGSELGFSAYEAGMRELAVIIESGQLEAALWHALREYPDVQVIAPAACAKLKIDEECAELELTDGRCLRARLVVGADGGDSWVRAQAGIIVEARPYAQTAVIANFKCEKPHRGIAHQWFRRDGILALLPLPGERVSMVWSTHETHATELIELPAAALAAEVAAASAGMLGDLSVITPPAAFPLRLQRVKQLVKPRIALVGDAAHSVHPLAGQGVNLGFRDARELAAVLAGRGAQHDCGDYHLLRRYERARREDVAAVQFTTDTLQKLFNNNSTVLAGMRNFGLRLTDRQSALKNLLVRHAVG